MHPATPWITPGAGKSAGQPPSATTFISEIANYDWTGPGLVADIQAWVDAPSANHGWLLASEDEATSTTAKRFGSSEGSFPPTLEIGFTATSPPPDIRFGGVVVNANGTLQLDWIGAPGWQYDLLSTGELTDPADFTPLRTDLQDSGTGTNQVTDLPLAGDGPVFYVLDARPVE